MALDTIHPSKSADKLSKVGNDTITGVLTVQAGYPTARIIRDVDSAQTAAGAGLDLGALIGTTPTTGAQLAAGLDTAGLGFFDLLVRSGGVLTKRLGIDHGGRLSLPAQPRFEVMAGGFVCANNTDYIAGYNGASATVLVNTGGHYNSLNGRFTAPVAGVYEFYANVTSAGLKTSNLQLIFVKNGAAFGPTQLNYYNDYTGVGHRVMMTMAAGDYVYCKLAAVNSASSDVYASSFAGQMLG